MKEASQTKKEEYKRKEELICHILSFFALPIYSNSLQNPFVLKWRFLDTATTTTLVWDNQLVHGYPIAPDVYKCIWMDLSQNSYAMSILFYEKKLAGGKSERQPLSWVHTSAHNVEGGEGGIFPS